MKAGLRAGLLLVCLAATLVGPAGPAGGQAVRTPAVRLGVNLKQIWVDGVARAMDVAPVILNDRMYVPFRHLAEALGAGIDYDPAKRKVTLTLGATTIELWLDQPTARVNGQARYIDPGNLQVTPVIRDGRTMLPLRFVAESLGAEVTWHPEDGMVSLAPVAPGGGQEEPPPRAGWYRIAGTVRDARTQAPISGVQVVARTDYGPAAGAPGTGAVATAAPAPATADAPDPAPADTPVAVRQSGPVRALGAPGTPDDPAGGTSGTTGPGASPPLYEFRAQTGADGAFQLDLPAGAAHRVSLTMACYAGQEFLVSQATRRDVRLAPVAPPFTTPLAAGTFRVYGQVQDQHGRPVPGACVAAMSPAGSALPPNLALPDTTQYMTDDTGTYFVDWPAWLPIKVRAAAGDCEGKGVAIIWRQPVAGEGGPRNAGTGSSPEPVPEVLDIPANPAVARDISVACLPPPAELPLAVTVPAGGSGTTVCQQSAGTDPGFVRMSRTASAIVTGQSVDLTASPTGDQAKPVLLRWWLDDPKGGTLYASGCQATYVAPASIGLAAQTSAFVLVAKEGDRKPYTGEATRSGSGFFRILIYAAANPPGGQAGCTAATYSVTAHDKHGDITRLDIQGIGTWRSAGARTVTVTGVPVGRYTVWVTTAATGTHTLQVQMACPVTRSYID